MKKKIHFTKTRLRLFALLCGGLIGAFFWIYLSLVSIGITFFWVALPAWIGTRLYTICLCLIGGVIVGGMHLRFGNYPETMDEAFRRLRIQDSSLPNTRVLLNAFCAVVTIVLGGSIGPEAGLVSSVISVIFWSNDCLHFLNYVYASGDVSHKDIIKALISRYPPPYRDAYLDNKRAAGLWLIVAAGGFITYFVLCFFVGGGFDLDPLPKASVSGKDLLGTPLLLALGYFGGRFYLWLRGTLRKFFLNWRARHRYILCGVAGGLGLGILGTAFPLVLCSGESRMAFVAENYMSLAALAILATGVIKLFTINLCMEAGWKGGFFFPLIFAGICLGSAIGAILHLDPVFCSAMVCGILLTQVVRLPIAMTILLLFCFPFSMLPVLLLSSIVGILLPDPGSGTTLRDRVRKEVNVFKIKCWKNKENMSLLQW